MPTEHRYSIERRVYAAAHDIEPSQVAETDGSFGDVSRLLAEDHWELTEALARALGMAAPDEVELWQILEEIDRLRSALGIQEGGSESG